MQPWWLLPAAFTVHMVDEIIWLPAWSLTAGNWHPPVGRREFALASVLVAVLVWLAAWAGAVGGPGSLGVYVMAGVAVLMLVNFFVPHAGAAWQTRRYAPGILTSAFVLAPVCIHYLWQGLALGVLQPLPLVLAAALVVAGAAIFWPRLFGLGRQLLGVKPPAAR